MLGCIPRDVDVKNVIFNVFELNRKAAYWIGSAFADVRLMKLPASWRFKRIPNGCTFQTLVVRVNSANRK